MQKNDENDETLHRNLKSAKNTGPFFIYPPLKNC